MYRSSLKHWAPWLLGFGALLCVILVRGDARADSERSIVMWDLKVEDRDAKFGVEGSKLAFGDPVHETLTVHALVAARILPRTPDREDPLAIQYIRGVMWNDDPGGALFVNSNDLKPSWGTDWYWDFSDAEDLARKGKLDFSNLKKPILGRSHFGDLQFLHGMANADGIPAAETRALMLAWAELAYNAALGKAAVGVNQWAKSYGLAPFDWDSMKRTLLAENDAVMMERAIGTLLHMVQDSFAGGHTKRGTEHEIIQFHSYAKQDHDKHKKDDMWRGGKTDIERIRRIKNGALALEASTQLLLLYRRKAPWSDVKNYLEQGPFRLSQAPAVSGP